jgi:hypothetical protein
VAVVTASREVSEMLSFRIMFACFALTTSGLAQEFGTVVGTVIGSTLESKVQHVPSCGSNRKSTEVMNRHAPTKRRKDSPP